jgi:hypothetical protein
MAVLDEHESLALGQFLRLLAEESFEPRPEVESGRILRGPEGQIIVSVALNAEAPSLSLAMLMAEKAEHLYKQTGCRFILAQRPEKDPQKRLYLWAEGAWQSLP